MKDKGYEIKVIIAKNIKLLGSTTEYQESLNDISNKILALFTKKTRSRNQNSYYWGVVIPLQLACFKERWGEQYTESQIHDWNKANIFNEVKFLPNNETFIMPGSSATKTTAEFEKRMIVLRQFFRDKFDWEIPEPNQQQLEELYKQSPEFK